MCYFVIRHSREYSVYNTCNVATQLINKYFFIKKKKKKRKEKESKIRDFVHNIHLILAI